MASTLTELFERSNTWTQYQYARSADNSNCRADEPRAAKFCLIGAFMHIYGRDTYSRSEEYAKLTKHLEARTWLSVAMWNDSPLRTQNDVLQLVKSLGI